MNKKYKVLFSFLLIGAVISLPIIRSIFSPVDSVTRSTNNGSKKETQKKAIKRSIASVPTLRSKKDLKRVYQGHFKDKSQITLINKVSDKWEEKYKSNFLRMISGQEIKDFKIELKKSIIQVRKNIGRNLEHIVVSYKKPNGSPFSFEAYIDSETGNLVQSWNQTHSEVRTPIKIEGSKFRYYEN